MFSSRVPAELAANRLSAELHRLRAIGQPIVDLTVTNPATAGIAATAAELEALVSEEACGYRPEPFGLMSARDAIARRIALRRGVMPPVDRIALTASTSEAYSVLFKLLCDAGDEVLVPQPGYPLFEHLARLDLVNPIAYRLDDHDGWAIDFDSLDRGWSTRTRAVVVVSPGNPTGSWLRQDDLRRLQARCTARSAALIVDEVFASYPIEPRADAVTAVLSVPDPPVLTFALDGLSKSCGLPQLKLGWIEYAGPPGVVAAARDRLELILDTYLSVGTPVQAALPRLLMAGQRLGDRIRDRVRRNLDSARRIVAGSPACDLLRVEAGWSAVIRVPAVVAEEALVLRLLAEDGVLVHPGYFFDFPREAYVVVSLLPPPARFDEGLAHVIRRAGIA